MNRSLLVKLGLVAAIGVMVSQNALALRIERYAEYAGGGGGGEFTVYGTGNEVNFDADAKHFDATYGWGFQTFCLELSEPWTGQPIGYTVNGYAIEGGGGAQLFDPPGELRDPISIGTAWLYRQFADGSLSGYDYLGAGRNVSARELQDAIWWLEEELTSITAGAQTVLNLALGSAELIGLYGPLDYEDLRANAQPSEFGVAVMNFYDATGHRQSMLTRVPDGGTTLVLLGVGLIGCMSLRRRAK